MKRLKYLTLKEWQGLQVRSREAMGNGYGALPAGTLFTVMGKWGGLELKSHPCPQCGVSLRFRKVSIDWVERV